MTCCLPSPNDLGQSGDWQLNHASTTLPCLCAWPRAAVIEPMAQEDIQ